MSRSWDVSRKHGAQFCLVCPLWLCDRSVACSGFMRGSARSRRPAESSGLRLREPEESRCCGARGGQDGCCRAGWQILQRRQWESARGSGRWEGNTEWGNLSLFIGQLTAKKKTWGMGREKITCNKDPFWDFLKCCPPYLFFDFRLRRGWEGQPFRPP